MYFKWISNVVVFARLWLLSLQCLYEIIRTVFSLVRYAELNGFNCNVLVSFFKNKGVY